MKYTLIAIIISTIYWVILRPILNRYLNSHKSYKDVMSSRSNFYYREKSHSYCGRYLNVKELPTLPVEKFEGFYSVSPNKWSLEHGVAYKIENDQYVSGIAFRPYSNYVKYEKFRKEKLEERQKMNADAADLKTRQLQEKLLTVALESVQNDINILREQARKEYEEARDTALEITERLK